MPSGIYSIEHVASGRLYIGSAVDLHSRWAQHTRELEGGWHGNQKLQNAWVKYGEYAFRFAVIEICPAARLIEREQHYIDTLDPHYNIAKIAGNHLGVKRSAETRKRLSESAKGRKFSLETRAKMRAAKLGTKLSDEHRKNISAAAQKRFARRRAS